MSEENMCEEVMDEEIISAEGSEAGSGMLGTKRSEYKAYIKIVHNTIEEIDNFINSDHSNNLLGFEEQLNRYIQYLSDTHQYIEDVWYNFGWVVQGAKIDNRKIEEKIGELMMISKENTKEICKLGLEKGEFFIQKAQEFLARDIEEEKRKDKTAYYDTCDNYARLCDGFADELEQRYIPIADDAGIIAKFDEQIKTLRQCSDDFEKRRF